MRIKAIGRISWVYWGSAFVLSVAAELVSLRRKQRNILPPSGYQAGDLGLDPFGLADDEVSGVVCFLKSVRVCVIHRILWRMTTLDP